MIDLLKFILFFSFFLQNFWALSFVPNIILEKNYSLTTGTGVFKIDGLNDSIFQTASNLSNTNILYIWLNYSKNNYIIQGKIVSRFDERVVVEDFQINEEISLEQINVESIGLTQGGFVVCWQKFFNISSNYDIVYRIFYDNDKINNRSDEFIANSFYVYEQIEPKITFLYEGGFFIGWSSNNQDGSLYGVYGKMFNKMFEPGNEFRINSETINNQTLTSLCTLQDGNILVVWTTTIDIDYYTLDCYGQIFSPLSLSFLGENFKINTDDFSHQLYATSMAISADRFAVAWMKYYFSSGSYQIRGQIMKNSGVKIGNELFISKYASSKTPASFPNAKIINLPPSINLPRGGFICFYHHSYDKTRAGFGIYGQIIDFFGEKVKTEFRLFPDYQIYQMKSPILLMAPGNESLLLCLSLKNGDYYTPFVFNFKVNFEKTVLSLINNSVPLNQGKIIKINRDMIDTLENVNFFIKKSFNGHFTNSNFNESVIKFSTENIVNGDIYFVHHGMPVEPEISLKISLKDDIFVENEDLILLNFVYSNLPIFPTNMTSLKTNNFNFGSSLEDKLLISQYNLDINCGDNDCQSIEFLIYGLENCYFYLKGDISRVINRFTFRQLKDEKIEFHIEKERKHPAFFFLITNGKYITSPISANISFNESVNQYVPLYPLEFRVDSSEEFKIPTYRPGVIFKPKGDFFVVWESTKFGNIYSDIDGQSFDVDCHKVGEEFTLNAIFKGEQMDPSMSSTNFYSSIIVWVTLEGDSISKIKAKILPLYHESFNKTQEFFVSQKEKSSFCSNYYNRRRPSVIGGEKNDFIVTWDECVNETYNIYMRKFVGIENPLLDEFQVNNYSNFNQQESHLAKVPNGLFVVVWQSFLQDGSDWGVVCKIFDWNMKPIFNEFIVNDFMEKSQSKPRVAALNSELFVVVWQGQSNNSDSYDIFAKIMSLKDPFSSTEFQVNSYIKGDQINPDVASLKDEFIVVWESYNQDGSESGVFAQKFDFYGQRMGNEFQVNKYSENNQKNPSITSDGRECFLITWNSYGQATSKGNLFAQKFCKTKTSQKLIQQKNKFEIALSEKVDDIYNSININGENAIYFLVWEEFSQEYGLDIFGQLFNMYSTPISQKFLVNTNRSFDQYHPSQCSSMGLGYFIITWASTHLDDGDIFCQIFDSKGEKQGEEFLVNSQIQGAQTKPRVSMNKFGYYIIVWTSYHDDIYSIKAQKFRFPNERIGEEFQVNDETPLKMKVNEAEISLNSQGDFVVIWFVDSYGLYGHFFNFFESNDQEDFHINKYYQMTFLYRATVHLYESGEFLIAYDCESSREKFMDHSYQGVFVQFFEILKGELVELTEYIQANTYFYGSQWFSGLSIYESGFLIAWNSEQAQNKGQLFDNKGNHKGSEITFSLTSNIASPKIFINSNNHVMISWFEKEGSQNHLWGQSFFIKETESENVETNIIGLELVYTSENFDLVDIYVKDDLIYLLESKGSLKVLKTLFFQILSLKNSIKLDSSLLCCQVTKDHLMYIISLTPLRLIVLDLLDNLNISILELEFTPLSLDIEENTLFLLDNRNNFYIFNISDPSFIKLQQNISVTKNKIKLWEIYKSRLYLLLDSKTENLIIYDIKSNFSLISIINLNGIGESLEILKNESFLYVASSFGLEIIDLVIDPPQIAVSIEFKDAYYLKLSSYDNHLSLYQKKNHILFSLENPLLPELVESRKLFEKRVIKSQYSEDETNIFALTNEINIIKMIFPDSDNLPPRFSKSGIQIIDENINSMTLSVNENYIYLAADSGIFVIDIQNLDSSSYTIFKKIDIKNISHIIFQDNRSFMCYRSSLKAHSHPSENEFIFDDALEFDSNILQIKASSINSSLIYVMTSTEFIILETSSLKQVSKMKFIFQISESPTKFELTKNENFVFISFGVDPFTLIDISDIFSPKISKILDYSIEIIDIATMENEQNNNSDFIFLLSSQKIYIYEFMQNTSSLTFLSYNAIFQGMTCIKLLSNEYAILKSESSVLLLNFNNISFPMIYEKIDTRFPNKLNDFIIYKKKFILLSTFETIGLYSHRAELFPNIKISNSHQEKRFDITFYPFDLKKGTSLANSTKILKIECVGNFPDWIKVDVSQNKISLYPKSLFDLIKFSQMSIDILFSNKIDNYLISTTEKNNLVSSGYLSNEGYTLIDPTNINDISNHLKYILSENYVTQSFIFKVNDFLVLNLKPILNISLQEQLNKFYPSYIHIDSNFDFHFDEKSFYDPENDIIVYYSSNLPSFLTFDSSNRRISGIPGKTDLGNYTFDIIASDQFSEEKDMIKLEVNNKKPKVNENLKIKDQKYLLGTPFVFDIPPNLFEDPESDGLTITVSSSSGKIPEWLNFNKDLGRLSGSPLSNQVKFYPKKQLYYQKFEIILKATDINNNFATTSFNIIYSNSAPTINMANTLKKQFYDILRRTYEIANIELDQSYEFSFSQNTFINENYLLEYRGYLNKNSPFPSWIIFDPINFKLFIEPPDDSLNKRMKITICASNGFQESCDSFEFEVAFSILYIVKLVAKIISPIIGIFGLIRYRYLIFIVVCKRDYRYLDEKPAVARQLFSKKIYLIYNDMKTAHKIFREIEKEIKKNKRNKKNFSFSLLLDSYLQHEKTSHYFIELTNKIQSKKKIETNLLLPDNTLYVILQCLIIKYVAKRDFSSVYRLYQRFKSNLIYKYCQNWYFEFVTIIENERDLEISKFPIISLDEEKIQKKLYLIRVNKKFPFCFCKHKSKKLTDIELKLIYGLIKADVFGIGKIKRKFYQSIKKCKGESILVPHMNIAGMETKKILKESSLLGKFTSIFLLNYKTMEDPLKQLPPWLKYEIKNEILMFEGTPTEDDIGNYAIRILHKNKFVIIEYVFHVKDLQNIKINRSKTRKVFTKNITIQLEKDIEFGKKLKLWNPNSDRMEETNSPIMSPKNLKERTKKEIKNPPIFESPGLSPFFEEKRKEEK